MFLFSLPSSTPLRGSKVDTRDCFTSEYSKGNATEREREEGRKSICTQTRINFRPQLATRHRVSREILETQDSESADFSWRRLCQRIFSLFFFFFYSRYLYTRLAGITPGDLCRVPWCYEQSSSPFDTQTPKVLCPRRCNHLTSGGRSIVRNGFCIFYKAGISRTELRCYNRRRDAKDAQSNK